MRILKITLLASFVFYFAVYLFMPFFITTRDFGPDMASEVSLSGFVWGGSEVRHIARYVQDNLRWSVPLQGLTRDIFVGGVVWPAVGFVLLILALITSKKIKATVIAALICLWGLIGGSFFLSDPVLNIGGLAYGLLIAGMFITGAMGALYGFILLKPVRKGGA
ncbi:MAG: hypothetical protein FWB88_03480 [Defluviitaleaceae bacterium]|nr:hypothetical protein [Defluviitaleaceae bacterium]MCL2238724.1 hypothetical protein [Defluviitaleaceae bacterium]